MEKDVIEFDGVVVGVLPDMNFKVDLDNNAVVRGYLAGSMKRNKIRVLLGDRVRMEFSIYDMTKGRVTRRLAPIDKTLPRRENESPSVS